MTMDTPRTGAMLPDVALLAPDGSPVPLSGYRHASNLILAFLGRRSAVLASPLVPDLKAQYAAIREAAAEVLIVLLGTPAEAGAARAALRLPFPVLADPDGRAHERFGADRAGSRPAIYVADRFGEIHFAAHPGGPAQIPTALDLLGWLNYIELLCPE